MNCFRPKQTRLPAETIAAVWIKDIKDHFPKFWAKLSSGATNILSCATDGEPRNLCMINVMKESRQFRNMIYEHDRAHSLNLLAKRISKHGLDSSYVLEMAKKLTTQQNTSHPFQKALKEEIQKFKKNNTEFVKLCIDTFGQSYEKLAKEVPTRFTGYASLYGSRWQLQEPILSCFNRPDIKEDADLDLLGKSFRRSITKSQGNFELEILMRFFTISANINKKCQSTKLTSADYIESLKKYKQKITTLKDGIPNTQQEAKEAAQKYYDSFTASGQISYALRSEATIPLPDPLEFSEGLQYSLNSIDNMINAEKLMDEQNPNRQKPTYSISSCGVERFFSTYGYVFGDLTQSSSNELVFLKIFAMKNRGLFMSIDPNEMAKDFLDKKKKGDTDRTENEDDHQDEDTDLVHEDNIVNID